MTALLLIGHEAGLWAFAAFLAVFAMAIIAVLVLLDGSGRGGGAAVLLLLAATTASAQAPMQHDSPCPAGLDCTQTWLAKGGTWIAWTGAAAIPQEALPDTLPTRLVYPLGGPTVPVEQIADSFAVDLLVDGFALAGDMFSTAAFRHFCPTQCREAGVLVFSPDALVPLKLGKFAAVSGTQYFLRRAGHRGWAKVLRYVNAAADLVAIIINSRLAIQGDKPR